MEKQHQWRGDLEEMHRLMEKQFALLEESAVEDGDILWEELPQDEDVEASSHSTKLRQRAKSRLAVKRRKQRETD